MENYARKLCLFCVQLCFRSHERFERCVMRNESYQVVITIKTDSERLGFQGNAEQRKFIELTQYVLSKRKVTRLHGM